MKRIIILLVSFSIFNVFSQNGEVVYTIKSIKTDNLDKAIVKGVIKEYDLMSFTLRYNNKKSHYKVNENIPYNKRWYEFAKIFTEHYNDWYQDIDTKESVYNQEIDKELYQISHYRMDGWKITDETKTIEGYVCYKAIRKHISEKSRDKVELTYIAWFTPEIPVPYGPIGIGGLPGLILQLEKPNLVLFTAKKITLNKKNIEVTLPKEAKKISVKESQKLMRLSRTVTPD